MRGPVPSSKSCELSQPIRASGQGLDPHSPHGRAPQSTLVRGPPISLQEGTLVDLTWVGCNECYALFGPLHKVMWSILASESLKIRARRGLVLSQEQTPHEGTCPLLRSPPQSYVIYLSQSKPQDRTRRPQLSGHPWMGLLMNPAMGPLMSTLVGHLMSSLVIIS